MITLYGRIPSKKNSTIAMARGKRIFHFPSNAYREWHTDASFQLKKQFTIYGFPVCLTSVSSIAIAFFAPDKRKTDLTNKAESIMDLLVDNKIIEDDNWYVIPKLELSFGGVDKENPRAEITII